MPTTRRALLGGLAAGAAVAVTAGRDAAAGPAPAPAPGGGGERPLAPTRDSVLHALRRLTFGVTPDLVDHVREVGLEAWLDEQLGPVPSARATAVSALFPALQLPAPALVATAASGPDAVRALRAATAGRAAFGERQVEELLVELCGNHLSIAADDAKVGALKVVDDRDVVRAHALGTFTDLLVASGRSPAMLAYLDQASSRGSRPNENYARELLELHTVGVDAGYGARDVRDAALALTGRTVDEATGLYRFRSDWHHVGPLRVLGWRSDNATAEGGEAVGDALLRYLAGHPSTARALATKVVRRLVADDPPARLVASAAKAYLAAGTGLVPLVRHVVASSEFRGAAGRKSQRPFDWFTASVRALGLLPSADFAGGGGQVVGVLSELGQAPFGWFPPDGYPDVAAAWASNPGVLARWRAAQRLVSGGVTGLQAPDVDALLGTPLPTSPATLADRLVQRLLGEPPRAALRAALVRSTGLAASAPLSAAAARQHAPRVAALVLCSPEAQVR